MTNENEAPERIWVTWPHAKSTGLAFCCQARPPATRHAYVPEALSDAKDKRIEELEAAIKRQAGAAKTLRNLTLAEVQHIKDKERQEYLATKTLDSERDANRILTDENETLQAKLDEETKANAKEVAVWDENCHALQNRTAELEAKLAKAIRGLHECEQEIDDYVRQEYPHDHPVQERYRQRGFSSNTARATLAGLKG